MANMNLLISAAKATDPIERMKYILAFNISGFGTNSTIWKGKVPLSPGLGETLQCEKDGCKIYIEMTDINPPTFNYLIKGPDNLFDLFGYYATIVKMNGTNNISGQAIGKNILKFGDGSMFTIVDPGL